MNILLLTNHSIEEQDQVRLLTSLGYDVFSIGAYLDPRHPLDDMRPPVLDAPVHPDLIAAVNAVKGTAAMPDHQRMAKRDLPDAVLDWADTIICHHLEHEYLWPQWARIRGKRVIWRTVGQSTHANEWQAQPFAGDGLEIVRYSPRERALPNYAGESAVIRFWKDADEWSGWTGEDEHVLIVTQNPTGRGEHGSWINLPWIAAVTQGLPVRWVGPGTESLGGLGKVPLAELSACMRAARCALYTGTQPASYTLALIELMMTGTPVVSIGPEYMHLFPYSPLLYEGHRIAPLYATAPADAREMLGSLLANPYYAERVSAVSRQRARLLFDRERIGAQWRAWLDRHEAPEPDRLDDAYAGDDDWPDVALDMAVRGA